MADTNGSAQLRALIVTVYGLYARDLDWLPIAGLVRLLADLGVDEPAVRSAISRLKRRGILDAERRGATAGYALSDSARDILREGDEHIFDPPVAKVEEGWLLAVFSVPEAERAKRHTLRSRLASLGFGSAAPGVWVAPAHRYELTKAELRRLGLESYVDLFRSDYLAFSDLPTVVSQWWDFGALRELYTGFIARYGPVLKKDIEPGAEASAFADWVRVLTAWRRLPYLDPGLPADLLPDDWPGAEAVTLFHDLHARLAEPARTHVARVLPHVPPPVWTPACAR